MTNKDPVVIVGAKRIPTGNFNGYFKDTTTTQLGAAALAATVEQSGIKPNAINEVIMGCVLPAGLGQAPARQASITAKIPNSVACTTINKMCGSGMKAVMLAHDAILVGSSDLPNCLESP